MTDLFDFTRDDVELLDLLGGLLPDDAFSTGPNLLGRLPSKQKQARAAIKQKSEQFEQLCEELALDDYNLFDRARMADLVRQSERMAEGNLRPRVEAVQEKLKSGQKLSPELRELLTESVGIAVTWLELQRKMSDKLELFRRSGPILKARLVSQHIDHEGLSREFMARFPKIRAALAN